MKVILLQDVKGQGKKGQLIDVSDGYARNFLLPRKLAQEATADNINTMKMNDKALQEKRQKEREQAVALAARKIPVDKRKIVVSEPIKNVGTYTVKCKLGYEVVADLTVEIQEA